MICAQYPPHSGPGATRMAAFAKGLNARDYRTTILTSERRKNFVASEWIRLEDINRVGDHKLGGKGGRGHTQPWYEKIINAFVPMEPTWTLSLRNLMQVFSKEFHAQKPDVILLTSNPLASSVGGALLKRKHGIPLIVEFRDPWTLNPTRNWPTFFHFKIEEWLEKFVLRNSDAVVMNTPQARTNLLKKYNWLDSNRVHVISHSYDGDIRPPSPAPSSALKSGENTELRIGYMGGFYMSSLPTPKGGERLSKTLSKKIKSAFALNILGAYGKSLKSSPAVLFEAISHHNDWVRNSGAKNSTVHVDFIGSTESIVNLFAEQYSVQDALTIKPRISPDKVAEAIHQYDLLYLTNPDLDGSPFISTKTFDYIAAGTPIFASLPNSDQTTLVERAKAGWVFRNNDVESHVSFLKQVTDPNSPMLKRFSPDHDFIKLFARSRQVEDLSDVIVQILGGQASTTMISPIISEGYQVMVSNERKG